MAQKKTTSKLSNSLVSCTGNFLQSLYAFFLKRLRGRRRVHSLLGSKLRTVSDLGCVYNNGESAWMIEMCGRVEMGGGGGD